MIKVELLQPGLFILRRWENYPIVYSLLVSFRGPPELGGCGAKHCLVLRQLCHCFQPTLWLSSAVDIDYSQCWLKALYFIFSSCSLRSSDLYIRESSRCHTLPFFLTFSTITHFRFNNNIIYLSQAFPVSQATSVFSYVK